MAPKKKIQLTFTILLCACLALAGCASTGSDGPAPALQNGRPADQLMESADQAARQGDLRAALVLYRDALDQTPSATLWHRIGAAHRELGNLDAAVHSYGEVIALDPQNAAAYEALGLLYMTRQDRESARGLLAKAVELEPVRWRAHNGLGILADMKGDHLAAVIDYQSALEMQPGSPMLLNNVGYSYYLAGDLELAEGYFRDALGRGDYKPAMLNLGLVYARKAQYDDAVKMLTKVLDRPTAYNDAAFIAMNNGHYNQAERMLREAIRMSPVHYPTAQDNLALVQARLAGIGGRQ
jgi:Tfp pilus assembly protein PilF